MKKEKFKCHLLSIFIGLIIHTTTGQNVDLETIVQGKPFKLSGAVAANSIFYSANENNARAPFTYFIQGSLNASFYQFSMPISYSLSNQGDQFNYEVPYKFNRLSLHPRYKWIQGHIGDATMSFSPYTLSGHQFTGGGVELSPKGAFKISAMAGRLLKATEDDENSQTIPAFYRFGYGLKLDFTKEKFNLSLTGFTAKDDINSILTIPEEKGVLPQENLVISLGGSYKISKEFSLKGEYASTAITQDLRGEETNNSQGIAGLLFTNRSSTEYYKAFNAGFDYKFDKYLVGVAYERIDPGYTTLGAYFFNSDFENITVNSSTTLFKDKLSLAFNIGYQRDDLESQKEQGTNRTVGSVNANFNLSEKTTLTGSYSNFTTFTNAKVNQFDVINDDNLVDNISDALDYRQLSQNANININHVLSKKETLQQSLNINYALADVFNEQDGIVRIGDASTFHNINSSYTMGFPKKNMNITTAINGTLNTIGTEDAITWGPTVSISKRFFDKKLNTGFATSYNQSKNVTAKTEVANFRVNASYIYKEKHNFNITAIQLFRKTTDQIGSNELTVTFGYNYNFNIGAPKFKKRKKATQEKDIKEEENNKSKEEKQEAKRKAKEEKEALKNKSKEEKQEAKRKAKEEKEALESKGKEEKVQEEKEALENKGKEEKEATKRKTKEEKEALENKSKKAKEATKRKTKEEKEALESKGKEAKEAAKIKAKEEKEALENKSKEEKEATKRKTKEEKEAVENKRKEEKEETKRKKEAAKNEREEINKDKVDKEAEENVFKFTYKEHVFEGSHNQISNQIVEVPKPMLLDKVASKEHIDNLELLESNMKANEEAKDSKYKKEAIKYLDYLYKQKALENEFNELTYNSIQKLYADISKLDLSIEKQYLNFLTEITEKQKRQELVTERELKHLELRKQKYTSYKWMKNQLEIVTEDTIDNGVGVLKEFKEKYISKVVLMIDTGKKDKEIESYLTLELAKFYNKKSKEVK